MSGDVVSALSESGVSNVEAGLHGYTTNLIHLPCIIHSQRSGSRKPIARVPAVSCGGLY